MHFQHLRVNVVYNLAIALEEEKWHLFLRESAGLVQAFKPQAGGIWPKIQRIVEVWVRQYWYMFSGQHWSIVEQGSALKRANYKGRLENPLIGWVYQCT